MQVCQDSRCANLYISVLLGILVAFLVLSASIYDHDRSMYTLTSLSPHEVVILPCPVHVTFTEGRTGRCSLPRIDMHPPGILRLRSRPAEGVPGIHLVDPPTLSIYNTCKTACRPSARRSYLLRFVLLSEYFLFPPDLVNSRERCWRARHRSKIDRTLDGSPPSYFSMFPFESFGEPPNIPHSHSCHSLSPSLGS